MAQYRIYMYKLENYVAGRWITGDGDGQQLTNAVTGEHIANATTRGLDFSAMTNHARKIGNRNLRIKKITLFIPTLIRLK